MKTFVRILICAIAAHGLHAQNLDETPTEPVPVSASEDVEQKNTDIEGAEENKPLLVTGKPATDPIALDEKPPESGVVVHVEQVESPNKNLSAKDIQLLAPFPAKPLHPAPEGWQVHASEQVPPFSRKVEIAPGVEITLNIRPHVLSPIADGSSVMSIQESGYIPNAGYAQTQTVGAAVSNNIQHLDEDAKQIGLAIDHLQQLLVSLPTPAVTEEATSPTKKR